MYIEERKKSHAPYIVGKDGVVIRFMGQTVCDMDLIPSEPGVQPPS